MNRIRQLLNEFCSHEIMVTFPANEVMTLPIEISIQTIVCIANAEIIDRFMGKCDGRYHMKFIIRCGPWKWRRIKNDAEKYFIYGDSVLVRLAMH